MNRAAFITLLASLTLGCTTAPPLMSNSDEAAIRELEERERDAVLNRDTAALVQLWSERFAVNTPANQVSPDRNAVLNRMRQGLIHYSRFERRIELVRVHGDIAVVMGGETIQATGAAPMTGQTAERRFSHIWHQEGGAWRLVARHANVIAPPASR
ncbi:nuclear transport factor 2 family protein [Piscinibacter sakaiensis]|uniref:nuclear transport factor 2 family protein n=1 Tax=Piscinibacter sakaiensis TaxID=1547922 RepID=UPI003AABCB50